MPSYRHNVQSHHFQRTANTPNSRNVGSYWTRQNSTLIQIAGWQNMSTPTVVNAPPIPGTNFPFGFRTEEAAEDIGWWRAWRRTSFLRQICGITLDEGRPIQINGIVENPGNLYARGSMDPTPNMLLTRRKRERLMRAQLAMNADGPPPHPLRPAGEYAYDLCTMLSEIQRHMLEPVIDGGLTWQLWTREEVVKFINLRLQRFLVETGINRKIVDIPITAGTSIYTLPQDLIEIRRVVFTPSGGTTTAIDRMDSHVADNSFQNWETTAGAVATYIEEPRESLTLQLVPLPSTSGTLTVEYVPLHSEIDNIVPGTAPIAAGTPDPPGPDTPLARTDIVINQPMHYAHDAANQYGMILRATVGAFSADGTLAWDYTVPPSFSGQVPYGSTIPQNNGAVTYEIFWATVGGGDVTTTTEWHTATTGFLTNSQSLARTATPAADTPLGAGGPAPIVITQPAHNLEDTFTVLRGSVNFEGTSGTGYIEYGATPSFELGHAVDFTGTVGDQLIEQPVSTLTPLTTYYYRIVAINTFGAAVGSTVSFTTIAAPAADIPFSVVADSVTQPVTQPAIVGVDASVTFRGTGNANGSTTTFAFQWGPTTAYENGTTEVAATLTDFTTTNFSLDRTGLLFGTTYHYRVVAVSVNGTYYGNDQTFATPAAAQAQGPDTQVCPNLEIPGIFAWAVKWGTIADMLMKEGEANDPARAADAEESFNNGVELAKGILAMIR